MKLTGPVLLILLGSLLASAWPAWAAPDQVYYRYTNDKGVQVLNDNIPPEYVATGYEIVSLNGTVVKTVPPVPSKEESQRLAEERKIRREQERLDAELRRRYSTVADIRAAQKRRLADLQGNISVLQSNLSGVRLQIKTLQTRAASMERSGQEVSQGVLDNLDTLNNEEQDILVQIEQRRKEFQKVENEFEQDIQRFEKLQANSKSSEQAASQP